MLGDEKGELREGAARAAPLHIPAEGAESAEITGSTGRPGEARGTGESET